MHKITAGILIQVIITNQHILKQRNNNIMNSIYYENSSCLILSYKSQFLSSECKLLFLCCRKWINVHTNYSSTVNSAYSDHLRELFIVIAITDGTFGFKWALWLRYKWSLLYLVLPVNKFFRSLLYHNEDVYLFEFRCFCVFVCLFVCHCGNEHKVGKAPF